MGLRSLVPAAPAKGRRRRWMGVSCGVGVVILGALVVWVASLALASSPSFPDVPASNPYYAAISELASRGIIGGYASGDFGPNNPVNRQQFGKMIVKALGLTVTGTETCPFTDVAAQSGSDPFYPSKYVAVCATHGITTGRTSTSFDPSGDITRQQLITMVVRAAGLSDPPPSYAPDFFPGQFSLTDHFLNARKAAYAGLLGGLQGVGPTYDFSASTTRGECAQILYNLLHHAESSTSTTVGGSTTTTTGGSLFRLVKTVQVAPNDQFSNGAFARVDYVPATGRLVVTYAGRLVNATAEGQGGHGWVEYTADMEPTGKSGVLNHEVADRGSVMVNNTLYDVSMHAQNGTSGWRIMKYDAATWQMQADAYVAVNDPVEQSGDPMVAWVSGQLDVSGMYYEAGGFPPVDKGGSTFHLFFSDDLTSLGRKVLSDTPHINGTSMIYVDGIYYFLSSTAYAGDVLVMKYDKDWHYLGKKVLVQEAQFPEGLAYAGGRFYVAYADTSQRTDPSFFPVYMNVHLAAFDKDWNLIEDVAVTDHPASDKAIATRPWILLHGNRVYVSYDQEGTSGDEAAGFVPGKAFVSMYELTR